VKPTLFAITLVAWTGCREETVFPEREGGGGYAGGHDAGTPIDEGEPPEISQNGTSGLLLRGTVLSPAGVLDPGEVLIGEDGLIVCVAGSCAAEPSAAQATVIETHGVISPGLIDAHNHITYNFLPEWVPDPPRFYQNRYQWADEPSYEDFVRPFAKNRSKNTHFCPGAKWAELRSMVHATTTVQGQSATRSCINWGVRNADSYHWLDYDHMRTSIGSPRDINDESAAKTVEGYNKTTEPVTRFAVHMAEGYAEDHVLEEFDSFAGRDPRDNRHAGTSLLEGGRALLIHCVPLTEDQLGEALETESSIVWSPSSNMVLYGRTAPIERILQLGITTGLGPDWTPSGEDEMLGEMRFALKYGEDEGIAALTPRRVWELATAGSADALGLGAHIGRLEVGLHGDVAVFARTHDDPYRAVIESRADDVRLVLLDGDGLYGDAALQAATAASPFCEAFDACGAAKYVCARETDQEQDNLTHQSVDDIQQALFAIMEGSGYPADEQYGRGAEVLGLVDCSR